MSILEWQTRKRRWLTTLQGWPKLTRMTASSVDISGLSATERVALMERLWEALDSVEEPSEPPAWHADVLRGRESEWEQRRVLSEDWHQAKVALRAELP